MTSHCLPIRKVANLRPNNALHLTPAARFPVRCGMLCSAAVAGELWR